MVLEGGGRGLLLLYSNPTSDPSSTNRHSASLVWWWCGIAWVPARPCALCEQILRAMLIKGVWGCLSIWVIVSGLLGCLRGVCAVRCGSKAFRHTDIHINIHIDKHIYRQTYRHTYLGARWSPQLRKKVRFCLRFWATNAELLLYGYVYHDV